MKAAENNGRQRALFPLDMTSWHWRDREQYPGTTRECLVGLRTGQHRLKGRPVTGNDGGGSSCQQAQHLHGTTRHVIVATASFSFSLFPSVLPYTSEQRKTRFIHLGDKGFLTQLLYETPSLWLEQLVSIPPFPEFQEAQEKEATTHKHRMAGTPDFVTSISHLVLRLYINQLNNSGHLKQPYPGYVPLTRGNVYVDYTVNGDCAANASMKELHDLQKAWSLGICWLRCTLSNEIIFSIFYVILWIIYLQMLSLLVENFGFPVQRDTYKRKHLGCYPWLSNSNQSWGWGLPWRSSG